MDNRYLLRQRQTWFVVVEVPSGLRKLLGRRIKRTLQTHDINVARARRHRAVADIKETIANAAHRQREGDGKDGVMAEAMAWRDALLAAEEGDPNAVIGVPADDDPASFLHSLIVERAEALESRRSTKGQAETFADIALGRATPLALHVPAWLADGTLGGTQLRARTQLERRRAVDRLGTWLATAKLPATIEAVSRRVAGRFIAEDLSPSGRDPVTLGKIIRSLASYWAWLQRRGHRPEDARNPWSGQAPHKTAKGAGSINEERAFTDTELARLLNGPADRTLADFMRVAALTGMRREEIGRLRVADCAGGVFVVREGKTAAAARRVPVHSGLVELVTRRCRAKEATAFLFDELRAGPNGEHTDALGKAFTRYRRRLGIQEGDSRRSRVNAHSFRRWFITAAVNAGQPAHMVSLVVGHTEGRRGMTLGRYWQGANDPALRVVVEAVTLPPPAAQDTPQNS